eukprot:XP_011675235.1 PREDICTED: WD repeat-containing protein 24 [Strongylocentrotus purpuratus]
MSRGTQERGRNYRPGVRSNASKTMGIKLDGGINAISLNKDATQVVAAGRQVFKIFHIEEMGFRERIDLRVGRMNLNYSCNDVAWHPSKDELIATGATNGAVITWDLNKPQGNKMDQVFSDHKRTVHKVSFHPKEWYMLFSGSNDGSMKFFDLRSNKCETTYGNGQSECIRDVQCSPHQYFILAATLDNGHIQFWDYRVPDKVLLDFPGHNGPAFNLDWHPEESKWIATCGRDKIIKIWRWEGHGNVLEPEYTIYAIASVNHIKWRPEKKYHIASCSGVVDHTICVWDVRRSYMPFAVFEEHKDIVTGIAWRQDPHVFLSGSKDSMLFQHKFKDAKRPAESANPVGVSMSIYDDVCHAFNKSSARTSMQSQQNYASTNFPMRFRRTPEVSEQYERYESSLLVHECSEMSSGKALLYIATPYPGEKWGPGCYPHGFCFSDLFQFSESFIKSAKRYILTGKPFPELCEHNAQVAMDLGRHQIAQTWRMLRLFYCTDTASATPPVYTNKGIPPTEANDSDKDTADNPCDPTFPACPEGSLNTTQVTNATVTVNSDDGNGGTNTSTVDATEAANSIVHCNTYTCWSLAYILVADYSTQYCLGFAPVQGDAMDVGYIFIDAVVSVEYTGGSGRSLFKASFDGFFVRSKYEGNPRCTVFGIDNTPTILTYPPDGSRLSTFSDCTSSTDSPANEPTTSVQLETTSPSLTSSSSPPSDHTLTASMSSPPDITAVSTHTFTSSTPGLNASSTQQTEVTSLKSHATMTKEL